MLVSIFVSDNCLVFRWRHFDCKTTSVIFPQSKEDQSSTSGRKRWGRLCWEPSATKKVLSLSRDDVLSERFIYFIYFYILLHTIQWFHQFFIRTVSFYKNCELSTEKRLIYCATDAIHITTNTTPETWIRYGNSHLARESIWSKI